eukprot:gene13154-3947_t
MDAFSFIGNIIEFECGEDNIYIGSVLDIDAQKQEISINNVSLNGTKLDVASLKIKAEDINNLTILSQTPKEEKALIPDIEQKPRSIEKKEKKEERFKSSQEQIPQMKKNQIRVEKKGNKKQKQGNQALMNKAEKYTTEFDFEGNLALFDKEAEFNELKENILQGITKSVVRNYKGNENILESEPVSLRQIKIPVEHVGKEYATDSGFIVPAISSELRDKLFTKAERAGLSAMQRTENAGVCTCKMALQLLGGERRICPKNAHQAPEIVLLAGPNLSGLQGICAARHLANHTATVTLFVPEVNSLLQSEIELFKKTNGVIINTVQVYIGFRFGSNALIYQELPSLPVDLVIDALTCVDNNDTQYDWLPIVIGWANHNKAPVLALDPCIRTAKQDSIVIKWSIALALPLIGSSKCGRLYLVDVGIPSGIFKDVGITAFLFLDSYLWELGDRGVISEQLDMINMVIAIDDKWYCVRTKISKSAALAHEEEKRVLSAREMRQGCNEVSETWLIIQVNSYREHNKASNGFELRPDYALQLTQAYSIRIPCSP